MIVIYQSNDEYPSLHLMVTDNPRYEVGKYATKDIVAALLKVERWLREKVK